ncbi:ATP-dependent Clp protease ATP-binding subunit [Treponema sp. Marseille-Q4523]|uniref:ATP-dependent Clp protease ATP-binding subunit n=1 Tax=Treponema sp. Marseille-Q4523 TaxID=2810610 RepID=UPI0019618846|nr:ATP-dependent Clp protease ATP-binding subunit [Treponema sp. Marseille-Q4523]MBM7021984.1 AAA family ATPase [Treponema sp. Marseille-Q4523]
MNGIGFSPRAQRLIAALAQDEGRKSGADQLLPEHVLLALLKSAEGLGYTLLRSLCINTLSFQRALEQQFKSHPASAALSDLPPSRRLKAMLDIAGMESRALGNDYVGTEHIVLSAIREEGSATARFFENTDITIEDARRIVPEIQAHSPSSVNEKASRSFAKTALENFFGTSANASLSPSDIGRQQTQNQGRQSRGEKTFLSEFSRDITKIAREEKDDPVVGRSKEIQRIVQVLSRRTKNNPVLIGEPGVGKTAIVEGLAQRIAKGNVPRNLLKKRILSLDLAALIAGTKYRGEFEERMKKMMKEVRDDKTVILFIDELHTIIGAGGPEGTMDASNMLKPALSRGEIQIIGATTTKEYSRYIEKDSALERRFQTVKVEEPTDDDTVSILEGIKKRYEDFHGIVFDDDVIPAIVKFSRRYIPERFLPDKAIDILDEAGAAKKIQEEAKPAELAEVERSIEKLAAEKRRLVEEQDYERAAIVRDKVLELRRRLDLYSEYWRNSNLQNRKHVSEQDICRIIGAMTGIPVEQLDSSETKRLVHMEEEMHKSVIGQDEAVHLIAGAVRRSRAGVSSPKHPLGSFIFLGPTGVGKTQLAKALAKFLFGSEEMLVRIDMSDYMEKHNASRLVGAPPGYVGYEEGGVLTEAVRRRPYSVVLLDEIEKAHPDVFNLLLQLLEEGELSDNLGHTVNFRNTVIIMTSNAGARQITSGSRVGFLPSGEGLLSYDDIKASALGELKKMLSPELLNRIDDVVVFGALTKEEVGRILDIQIKELADRMREQNITVSVKPKAREYLIEHGYEPELGARPMRRLIRREIEDPLSVEILSGEGEKSNSVSVEYTNGKLRVKFVKPKQVETVLANSLTQDGRQ